MDFFKIVFYPEDFFILFFNMVVHKADNNSATFFIITKLTRRAIFVIFEIIVFAAVKQSLIDSLITLCGLYNLAPYG